MSSLENNYGIHGTTSVPTNAHLLFSSYANLYTLKSATIHFFIIAKLCSFYKLHKPVDTKTARKFEIMDTGIFIHKEM